MVSLFFGVTRFLVSLFFIYGNSDSMEKRFSDPCCQLTGKKEKVILPGRRSVVVGRIVHRSAVHHAGRDLERYLIHSSECRMYPKYTSDLGG